ncbi:MAG TPA: patatin-like phospholipase family protein [Flexilinea sp.]|nr:patatin-like phospholipase family protein [Flexilinea sp.]
MTATIDDYGLVFSGGGTRGAYEIGAWKALNELGIKIQGVVGASIGAINGALFLQGDIDKAEKIYRGIRVEDILEIEQPIDTNHDLLSPSNLTGLIKELIQQKGLSNSGLKNMILQEIDLDKIYNSDLDYGLVTFSIDSLSPIEKFKEDIPKEELVDYIVASANFPIFKPHVAGGSRYIDGGIYDNMPINMLIKKGYRKIIVIDLSGEGFTRKMERKDGVYLKIIRASENLGGTFEFDQEKITRNIQLGYLDTLKAFQKLQGHSYYFTPEYFNHLLENFNLDIIYGLESAAKHYGIDRYQIFKDDSFLSAILEKHRQARKQFNDYQTDSIMNRVIKSPSLITKMINSGMAIAWFEEMVMSWPGQKFAALQRFFGEYMMAAYAMIELQFYMDDFSF